MADLYEELRRGRFDKALKRITQAEEIRAEIGGPEEFIDTLQVARADTRDIGVRTLSTPRTILAVAGGVAAVAGAFALFKSDASGLPGDDPGEVIEPITLIRTLGALLGLGR